MTYSSRLRQNSKRNKMKKIFRNWMMSIISNNKLTRKMNTRRNYFRKRKKCKNI